MDYTSYNPSYTITDPISSFFGGIFFIIILVLVLIFMVILMVYNGISWVGNTVTGEKKKEGFTQGGPYPLSEHDERCATFPTLR